MGKLLSKFRKEKSTTEKLDILEQEIKDIEAFTVSTQARQKRYVGNFLVISIGLYVIAFIVFYFVFFPPTWNERIVYSTPMLLFPILIFFIKRAVAWYFQRKVNINSSKLRGLRAEKKKILELVQEKETYKVAIEILNKYGEKKPVETHALQASSTPRNVVPVARGGTPQRLPASLQTPQGMALRQRAILGNASPAHGPAGNAVAAPTPQQILRSPGMVNRSNYMSPGTPRRTPFPVIDQGSKGVLEKMVDYLIGDGPANRLAMICKQCYRHNGMALFEEYEYASFICAFCGAMNPAKKQRPIAPRLERTPERSMNLTASRVVDDQSSSSSSEEEKNSGGDDETIEESKVENIEPSQTQTEEKSADTEAENADNTSSEQNKGEEVEKSDADKKDA